MFIIVRERYTISSRVCVPFTLAYMCTYMCRVTLVACVYIMVASRESEIIESSTVTESHATLRLLLAERMRSCTFIFVALATVLLYTKYINALEICSQENCLTPDKCEESIKSQVLCEKQGTTCCSIVKSEFRTHCRHHGGECMDKCALKLQHNTVDCPSNQVCCVLV